LIKRSELTTQLTLLDAQPKSHEDQLRLLALETIAFSTAPPDEVARWTIDGRMNVAPLLEDVLQSVKGQSITFEGSHRIFNAAEPLLRTLQESIGKTIVFAADPASGEILMVTDTKPGPPPAPSSERPRYDSLSELQKNRPEQKPALPRLRHIKRAHAALARQPHIPFAYPSDVCRARAESMCQLLVNNFGVHPRLLSKVWISCQRGYDRFQVSTDLSPECKVDWQWHVAPLVESQYGYWVIDPALSDVPLTRGEWRSRIHATKTSAKFQYSTWERYGFSDGADVDQDEKEKLLAVELRRYRDYLSAQIVNHGPIPYAHCR